jgi:hypothetical protein
MNINSKEMENTTTSTSTRRRTRSQKTSGSLRSKLEVFIWPHVVYVPKLSTTFRGILICVIFRPSDMQEYYMLFGIFANDVGLYFLSVFYIAWADFQYTNVYLFCVLHTYHCVPFTGECHGTAAYKAQTTSIYDVIGHRLIKDEVLLTVGCPIFPFYIDSQISVHRKSKNIDQLIFRNAKEIYFNEKFPIL